MRTMIRQSCYACGAGYDLQLEYLDEEDSELCAECRLIGLDYQNEEEIEIPMGLLVGAGYYDE